MSDLGLGGPNPPVWARDNPFLFKAGLADLRRFRLGWRLAWTVGILGAMVLGAEVLARAYPQAIGTGILGAFGVSLPFALLCLLTFVHATMIASVRQVGAFALAEEMRRRTLPDLLMTPLRPAEMALAMGVGPARTAALTALVGLPVYALLAQIGVLTGRDVLLLLLLFLLTCYAPPVFVLPVRGGEALTPDTAAGKAAASLPMRRAMRGGQAGAAVWSYGFAALAISPLLGTLGGWLVHLLTALGLSLPGPMGRILVIFAWPVFGAQLLGTALPLFHARVYPLPFLLLLLVSGWVATAQETASALSASDAVEMARLPLLSRARTVRRWAGRLAALLGVGVVWTAWVESGDTATLAGGGSGTQGAEAAGLLLLLGGVCLMTLCQRAFASPTLSLRRVLGRGGRPLFAAGVLFLLACALGGVWPFASAVGTACLELLAVGAATIVWGWSLARRVPSVGKSLFIPLLVPLLALSLPAPLSLLSVLSPVAAWVRLFPPLAALVPNLPWHPAALPPLWECLAGLVVVGVVLAGGAKTPGKISVLRTKIDVKKPVVERHQELTARLIADVTARTDNPLFTHEMRVRTRSGRWADWRFSAPGIFAAACLLGLTYPEVIAVVSFLSPFHFFPTSFLNGGPPWANLATLTLTAECFFLAFRAPARGEALLMRDRQRGSWGFLLLTPLSAAQIFRGKLLGQSAGPLAALGVFGVAVLLFSLLSAFTVGLLPALAAWAVGQAFALSLWLLGTAVGAALSSWNVFSKGLRGAAPLLFTGLAGLGVWAQFQWLPLDFGPNDWWGMATRLILGIAEMLPVWAGLLWFAEWRIGAMRRRDIMAGDGTE